MTQCKVRFSQKPSTYKKYSLRCTLCGGARFPSSASTISNVQQEPALPQTSSKAREGGEGKGGSICREYSECWNEASFTLTVENHDGCDVSAAVAIIWGAPYGDEVLIKVVLVPLHDKLMSASNQR